MTERERIALRERLNHARRDRLARARTVSDRDRRLLAAIAHGCPEKRSSQLRRVQQLLARAEKGRTP